MISQIILSSLLAVSIGASLGEPLRASTPVDRSIMNSTQYNFDFVHEMTLHAHSEDEINTESSSFWQDTYIWYTGDTKPTDVYYWVNEIDNEQEVLVTFDEIPVANTYSFTLPDLSRDTVRGIQFFQKKSLVGDVYYINQPNLSNVGVVDSNILPEGSTANLSLSSGSPVSITSLRFEKTAMEKGIIGFAQFKINNLTYIANNSLTSITPNNSNEVTNVMMYKSTYTNILTFTHGDYPRGYNIYGYSELHPLLSSEYQAYISYSTANNMGISLEPLTTGITLVGLSFEALNSLFGYLVFPGITLGMLLLVPVILGLFFAIIKLVKKGG